MNIRYPLYEGVYRILTSYEAVPTAVYRIRKTSKRFRQRKEPKGGKEKNNVKLTAIWIKSNW